MIAGMGKVQLCGYAASIVRIGLVEVDELTHPDALGHAIHRGGDVAEPLLFLVVVHEAEKVAGLGVVVVADAMVVAVRIAGAALTCDGREAEQAVGLLLFSRICWPWYSG